MIWDVAVVGGGPAGSAVATVLAGRGRRVVLFERSRFETPRVGETLGGEVRPLLRALGAWDAFAAMAQVPFRTVRSAWGSANLAERSSITHPFGDGFHVERSRLDALLAQVAEAAGASWRLGAGLCTVVCSDQGFRVQPASGEVATARVLVDASGRGAPATAALPNRGRWLACDRMVALVGSLTTSRTESDLLIEASEDGWWYSVPQPDGQLIVALMTDADLTPAGPRNKLTARWHAALARTQHTAARCHGARVVRAIRTVRAETGHLQPDCPPGFWAVGDAAVALDPLAGNGVARALRSGLATAGVIDLALAGAPVARSVTAERFADDLDRRASYYLLESRWPAALFWARRHPPDWTTTPLTLSPTSLLRWDGRSPGRDALAKVEALLPRSAIAATLDLLRTPQAAHAALGTLRDHAPLGDRRLLVGLQVLVEFALLEVAPTQ